MAKKSGQSTEPKLVQEVMSVTDFESEFDDPNMKSKIEDYFLCLHEVYSLDEAVEVFTKILDHCAQRGRHNVLFYSRYPFSTWNQPNRDVFVFEREETDEEKAKRLKRSEAQKKAAVKRQATMLEKKKQDLIELRGMVARLEKELANE